MEQRPEDSFADGGCCRRSQLFRPGFTKACSCHQTKRRSRGCPESMGRTKKNQTSFKEHQTLMQQKSLLSRSLDRPKRSTTNEQMTRHGSRSSSCGTTLSICMLHGCEIFAVSVLEKVTQKRGDATFLKNTEDPCAVSLGYEL